MASPKASDKQWPPVGEIATTIRIPTEPGESGEVVDALRSIVGPSLAQSACTECGVVVDVIEDRYVLFHERWSSFEAFERHARSALYERVLAAIDMASDSPDVRFECMERRWGLELVRDLRMKPE